MEKKADVIALYLPQYHPTPENDMWYGKGFTEWTNVAKAKPLFPGHYQPHIPADLGFYDLRLPEVRHAQASLAAEHGVSAFCFWNYWFGEGKKILERPIWDAYNDKSYKFPFCIGWANSSWYNKMWDAKKSNELLLEQKYLGEEDYQNYFDYLLPLFMDDRYYRVEGKLLFVVYQPTADAQIKNFIQSWRELAQKNNLGGFYFVGHDFNCRGRENIMSMGFDAVYDDNMLAIHTDETKITKALQMAGRKLFNLPTIFDYRKAIDHMILPEDQEEDVIPVIVPNWDHSPRTGRNAFIFTHCTPDAFELLVQKAVISVSSKKESKRLIFLKSWNEWGEGNHMEPDLKYGMGYLEALKRAIIE